MYWIYGNKDDDDDDDECQCGLNISTEVFQRLT
jgi:hypothetical protein